MSLAVMGWFAGEFSRGDGIGGISREHFERDAFSGPGKRMGVLAHEQRSGDPLVASVIADGLCNGEDVRFGERSVQACTAMAAGAEADELIRVA